MQQHNFNIEDDVLDKLTVLRDFNDEVHAVSEGAQKQNKTLRKTIDTSMAEHKRAIQEQDDTAKLQQMLVSLEKKLTDLRVEADNVQIQSNGLVARHIEELTIDVNGKSNVDRKPLENLHQTRD